MRVLQNHCAAILAVLAFFAAFDAIALQPDVEAGRQAAATLPESNDAILLSGRIDDAIRAGDYQLAVQLIGRLTQAQGELVGAAASRTYYPVWRQVFRLVAQLPEPGLEVYRQLHDADVAARHQDALTRDDTAALLALFRQFPLTSAWRDLGRDAAARLIDAGQFDQAVEVLRELLSATDPDDTELRAQMLVAMGEARATRSATRLLAELNAAAAVKANPAWRERVQRLGGWLDALRQNAADVSRQARFLPRIDAGPQWSVSLIERDATAGDDDADLAEAVEALRRLPLIEPVIADDTLLVRVGGVLWAIDALTLTPRWSAPDLRAESSGSVGDEVEATAAGTQFKLTAATRLLLKHHLRHVVSAAHGRVYTVEGLSLQEEVDAGFRGAFQIGGADVFRRNEIVARSLATGRIEWRTSQDASSPLAHVAFQDRPLPLAGKLIAAFHRDDDLRLAVIDPATGKLEREIGLIGPPTRFDGRGGRSLLATDGQCLFVSTGNGVVAAFGAADLSWRWATVYFSSTLAAQLGRLWWQPREAPEEAGVDRPLIVDDLLIVAPIDAADILALDRFSGRERWRIPRRDYSYVVGVADGGLILGGNALVCLDLDDPEGRPPRWRSVPMDVVGRPVLRDSRLIVPTRRGLVVMDARNGKIVADQESSTIPSPGAAAREVRAPAANLIVSSDALLAVSAERVVKYPDLDALRKRVEQTPDSNETAARRGLALAWLALLSGSTEESLRLVESLPDGDPMITAARDQLMAQLFLELASQTAGGTDRLAWLRQASRRVTSPDAAARLARVIGDALEADARWAEALDHYAEILCRKESRAAASDDDSTLRSADWLHAASRVDVILRKLDASASEKFIASALDRARAAEEPVRAMLRLRSALIDHPRRRELDFTLAQQPGIWPEVAIRFLPAQDDPALPEPLRRTVHLARWEAHVSLDRQAEAQADAAYWDRTFAATETTGDEGEAERERVAQIRRTQEKLARIRATPFTREYGQHPPRWKIKRADLVLDTRRPLDFARQWILVRNFEARKIQLIDSIKHQTFAWRQYDDATDAQDATIVALRGNVDAPRRATWPAVIDGDLAAIPAKGQLVAVGLAPQNRQAGPLWRFPVSTWTEIPVDFESKAVATPRGVYFSPRQDRIALVGWIDGRLWWQRDFPGVVIEKVALLGDDLVVISEDRQVFLVDAATGGSLRRLPLDKPTPIRIDVAGGRVVVWSNEAVAGFDPKTGAPSWMMPVREIETCIAVHGRNWLLYREKGAAGWQSLDVDSGRPAHATTFLRGEYAAAAVDGDTLLIAAQSMESPDAESLAIGTTTIAAYDLTSGARRWSTTVQTSLPTNLSQLCGHPQYVPMLLNQQPSALSALFPTARPYLGLQLIDKSTGNLTEPISIADRFEPATTECESYLLVTPARMIVQTQGNVLAFGNPPESPEP